MLFVTLIAIAAVLIIYFMKSIISNLNYWKNKGIKYVEPVPLFGNMWPTINQTLSMPELIQKLYSAFPNERYVGIYQFHTPVLLIRDPELIKSVTIKNFENFVDHTGFISAEADPLWGKNLFASEGTRWKNLRQTISPAFTSSKMRSMFVLMDECAQQLVNYFKENTKDVIDIDLKEEFTRFTNDVIASTAFGIKCNSFGDRNNEFLTIGRELTDMSGLTRLKFLLCGKNPKFWKFLGVKLISDRVGNFFRSAITEAITSRETNQIVRPDLIHLLMLARKGKLQHEESEKVPEAGFAAVEESEINKSAANAVYLTNEDITAQAVVFFIGGYDTTANLMSFAGYELALNPLVQKKLKEEILRTHLVCDGKITYEILFNLKYLDMVLSETLRKWAPAPWLDRKCTKDFEIPPEREGEMALKVKKGDVCWIPVFGIQWDPKYYPEPEIFDPERFSEDNSGKIQSATFLPFGIGPRNCIGSRYSLLGAKILLYNILLHYEFVPTEKTTIPMRISKKSPFMQPENGFYVGLKPYAKSD